MKPDKNHPWRKRSIKVETWAKEQSETRKVSTVTVARPTTMTAKRTNKKAGQV